MSKIWFVTGSSRGLGREIVIAALKAGDSVAASARNVEDLRDLVADYGDRVLPLALDVTDWQATTSAVTAAKDHFGRIDVVVNNAGYANTVSVEDIDLEDFKRQIDTNFFGVVHLSKAVVPIMREQGSGHIVQIASVGARITSPGLSAYQSAKFAVRGFSLVLAQELAPLGIKVTVVQPGGIRTDWAGASMDVPPTSSPYEPTVGAFAKMLRNLTGKEATGPVKLAEAIVALADQENPPVDLLMGADAFEYAARAAKAVADADWEWRDISLSVSFDPSANIPELKLK